MSESLQIEVDRLRIEVTKRQLEVEKVTKTLKTVEKEANITYNDCVAKFVSTQDFCR